MKTKFLPSPNSFKKTFCIFKEMDLQNIQNLKPDYKSDAGSQYFYNKDGMYRLSNHWGRLANSKWRLIASDLYENESKFKLGFANWENFYPDNNHENLYYLEYDSSNQTINYQHKNNPIFDNKPVLRSSLETAKRIKQARNILTLSSWAKYFENDNIEELRTVIINELIFTNKTLDEIKRNLL
jgi:hypothetical protein